jgi:hypothetical protein
MTPARSPLDEGRAAALLLLWCGSMAKKSSIDSGRPARLSFSGRRAANNETSRLEDVNGRPLTTDAEQPLYTRSNL